MIKPCLYALTALLVLTPIGQGSQTIPLSENKRLSATISVSSMNRIAIANDRISQVFGDEGTFVTQSDESTGQVFIKPSAENATKPLSITLITENGITQDLTLEPKEKQASTIILKGLSKDGTLSGTKEVIFDKTLSIQENILTLVKKAILDQLPSIDLPSTPARQFPEGATGRYLKSYQAGPLFVYVFELDPIEDDIAETLDEKAFYQPGDIAICMASNKLIVVSRT